VSRHNQKIYAFVFQLLKRAKDEGLLRTDVDIDVASWGYMSMVFTMQYSQMLDLHDKFSDTILAEMNQLCLQALQA